jgi:anti-sigma factor RsiW
MMTCDDVQNGVFVYLDGEFAPPESKAFEHHVATCSSCRTVVEGEGAFLAVFKAKVPRPSIPSVLSNEVEAILDKKLAPRPRESRHSGEGMTTRAWFQAAGWAAAACLVFGMVWWVGYLDEAAKPNVEAALSAHERDLPMEVRGSREQVRSYLQRNVAFSVRVPGDGVKGLRLTGARLLNVGSEAAVLYTYDMNGRRVSIVQTESSSTGDEATPGPVVQDYDGVRGFSYNKNGLYNTVVGNVRRGDLKRLVRVQP